MKDSADDLLKLANDYYSQQNYSAAQALYEQVLPLQQVEADILLFNIANCCLQQAHFTEAIHYYQQALKVNPTDADSYYNLGVIALRHHQLKEAQQYFLSTIDYQPQYRAAHINLGVTYLKLNQREQALSHYQQALELNGDDASALYTVAALTGKQTPTHAPLIYISELFDRYALNFDHHLRVELNYSLPEIFENLFKELSRTYHQALELGCGTGLCGSSLRAYAKHLIGIDISEAMLNEAKTKHIYDELITADFTEKLLQYINQLDMIMAADTLVYQGDLHTSFSLCQQALKSDGIFMFNVEVSDDYPYQLMPTGRYAHHQHYLEELASQYKFNIVIYKTLITRYQEGNPVYCHIYVMSK